MDAAALIFDAYGTLFDVASLADACAGVAPDPARLVTVWRAKQLEYSFLRALMGPAAYVDFWQVTADALDFAAQQLDLALLGDERRRVLDGWLGVATLPRGRRCASPFERLWTTVRHPIQRQSIHAESGRFRRWA